MILANNAFVYKDELVLDSCQQLLRSDRHRFTAIVRKEPLGDREHLGGMISFRYQLIVRGSNSIPQSEGIDSSRIVSGRS